MQLVGRTAQAAARKLRRASLNVFIVVGGLRDGAAAASVRLAVREQRDHRNRGGRFCANNSTSIRTRLRQKIDKNNDDILGLCCKVIPYRLEKLGFLLQTSETRRLPRVAAKRSTQKCETLKNATEVSGAFPN